MGGIISRGCGFRSMPQDDPNLGDEVRDSGAGARRRSAAIRNQSPPSSGAGKGPGALSAKQALARDYLQKTDASGAWTKRHSLVEFSAKHSSLSASQLAGGPLSSGLQRRKSVDSLTGKPPKPRPAFDQAFLDQAEPETILVGPHRISADPHRLLRKMKGAGKSRDDVGMTSLSAEAHEAGPLLDARSHQWFVMRTSGKPMAPKDAERNRLFAARASRACLETSTKIRSGEHDTLMDVWEAATAFRLSTFPVEEAAFASPRFVGGLDRQTDRSTTPITSGYVTLLSNDGTNGSVDASKLNVTQRQEISIGGKTVPLTGLKFILETKLVNEPMFGEMIHTDVEHIPALMEYGEHLMQEVLSDSITPTREDKLNRLGELQWIMAQAMPDERGSAFKSEFCTRSIALAKDIVLPPYKEGVAPDLDAFANTREEFVRRFAAVFDPARADVSLFEQP